MVLRLNDSVHFFIDELRARVVAESGIPSDRFHLGKLILRSFKDDPDFISQIDGITDSKETCGSLLRRSIQCANYFKSLGLKKGDIICLMAPNHLDLAVPLYAALYLGIAITALNIAQPVGEIKYTLELLSPNLIITQSESVSKIKTASEGSDTELTILTFDAGNEYTVLSDMLKKHENGSVDQFKAEDFDPVETIALLAPTSGTTGLQKFSITTHKNMGAVAHYIWSGRKTFPTPDRLYLLLSPLSWFTGSYFFIMTPIMRISRLQISKEITLEVFSRCLNTYRPSAVTLAPALIHTIVEGNLDESDFSCFKFINIGGNSVGKELLEEVQKAAPGAIVTITYGSTEANGRVFLPDGSPIESCGKPARHLDVRLIDVDTEEVIYGPNRNGELLIKGPSVFKGYYKMPEQTKNAFTEDGWFKTGDIFYRDENWNYYFVERTALRLIHRFYKVSPIEVEDVIRKHPEVLDIAVTGVPDPADGDLVTACVVRRPGSKLSAKEIKDTVKGLPEYKHLSGGVIFLDGLPMTTSNKLHRQKLRDLALEMPRE